MTSEEAFTLLGLEIGATTDVIRRAWRVKSIQHHPDAGGSNESMVRLNLALETALLQLLRKFLVKRTILNRHTLHLGFDVMCPHLP